MTLIIAAVIIVAAIIILYFWMTAGQRRAALWLSKYSYAHRGMHGDGIPENSLASFERAAQRGYAIELDVRLSSDGEIVVFHDATLSRMAGIDKNVSDMSAAELGRVCLGGTEHTIPTLRKALELVDGRVPLLIETKNEGSAGELEEKLYELTKGYKGEYAVQSFSPFSIGWFKKNAPEVPRGQLSSAFEEGAMHIAKIKRVMLKKLMTNFLCRPNFISYDANCIDQPVVQRLKREGITLLAWTVRSHGQQEGLSGLADAVIFENYEA